MRSRYHLARQEFYKMVGIYLKVMYAGICLFLFGCSCDLIVSPSGRSSAEYKVLSFLEPSVKTVHPIGSFFLV